MITLLEKLTLMAHQESVSLRFQRKDTKEAMTQLILAYQEARDDSGIDKLLLIPCFILDFLCIHPFRDGNGRMSRLLTLLLLYKADFDISKYVSFEEQINKMKDKYYEDFKKSSEERHENKNDYIPFIEDFLYSLHLCYKELDKRFLALSSKKVSKKRKSEANNSFFVHSGFKKRNTRFASKYSNCNDRNGFKRNAKGREDQKKRYNKE